MDFRPQPAAAGAAAVSASSFSFLAACFPPPAAFMDSRIYYIIRIYFMPYVMFFHFIDIVPNIIL